MRDGSEFWNCVRSNGSECVMSVISGGFRGSLGSLISMGSDRSGGFTGNVGSEKPGGSSSARSGRLRLTNSAGLGQRHEIGFLGWLDIDRVGANNAGIVSGHTCNFLRDTGFGMVGREGLVRRARLVGLTGLIGLVVLVGLVAGSRDLVSQVARI